MKIFIKNYSLSKLINKISSLKHYLIDTKTKLEITTNDGQYYIDKLKVYKIIVKDKDTILYENYYDNLDLLVDYSHELIIETNQIPNYNIEMVSKYYYFALNKITKLKFVIKTCDDIVEDLNKIKPLDFYFEIEGDIEINSLFFKDEINVFLSLLN
jgi:hypothetical protein